MYVGRLVIFGKVKGWLVRDGNMYGRQKNELLLLLLLLLRVLYALLCYALIVGMLLLPTTMR